MNLSEMENAVNEAGSILARADMCAERMARLLKGRLRKVGSSYTLKELKKELSQFNAHTGKWKEQE